MPIQHAVNGLPVVNVTAITMQVQRDILDAVAEVTDCLLKLSGSNSIPATNVAVKDNLCMIIFRRCFQVLDSVLPS